MTDKKEKIIIDGIDVSECYGYVHNAKDYDCGETYSKFHYRYCEENPNCYFKQLKRKEQECEKLKKRLESFQKDYSKLYQVVENKDYIKELDQYKQALDIIEEYCKQCNLRWDFTAQIVLDIINKTKEK